MRLESAKPSGSNPPRPITTTRPTTPATAATTRVLHVAAQHASGRRCRRGDARRAPAATTVCADARDRGGHDGDADGDAVVGEATAAQSSARRRTARLDELHEERRARVAEGVEHALHDEQHAEEHEPGHEARRCTLPIAAGARGRCSRRSSRTGSATTIMATAAKTMNRPIVRSDCDRSVRTARRSPREACPLIRVKYAVAIETATMRVRQHEEQPGVGQHGVRGARAAALGGHAALHEAGELGDEHHAEESSRPPCPWRRGRRRASGSRGGSGGRPDARRRAGSRPGRATPSVAVPARTVMRPGVQTSTTEFDARAAEQHA